MNARFFIIGTISFQRFYNPNPDEPGPSSKSETSSKFKTKVLVTQLLISFFCRIRGIRPTLRTSLRPEEVVLTIQDS